MIGDRPRRANVNVLRFAIAFAGMLLLWSLPWHARASSYADTLRGVARQLDHAANTGGQVPAVHVPPAPLGGPPRYSPSLDDWLQSAIGSARHAHKKEKIAQLRAVAATLRQVAGDADRATAAPERRGSVEADARAILREPAYRIKPAESAPPTESIWERILEWIFERLNELFSKIAGATQGTPVLGTIFAIALIGLAVGLLAIIGYRLASGLAARRRHAESDLGEPLPQSANAETLLAAARDAAAQGRFARAIVLLFQTALVLLDRRKGIAFDPARTAGEYRRLVRRKADTLAPDFDILARSFSVAAYADAPTTQGDWDRAAHAYAGLDRRITG